MKLNTCEAYLPSESFWVGGDARPWIGVEVSLSDPVVRFSALRLSLRMGGSVQREEKTYKYENNQ